MSNFPPQIFCAVDDMQIKAEVNGGNGQNKLKEGAPGQRGEGHMRPEEEKGGSLESLDLP